jgi:hypothetical protein
MPALALLLAALGGCRSSGGVTASRIENAIAPTFANLVHVQESMLGLPAVAASALRATASCHKVGAGADAGGGGNWKCTITWFAPAHRDALRDTYDLSVTMDGCYTATADGAEAHVGGPTLTTKSGASVQNLLYVFDGCFDTT